MDRLSAHMAIVKGLKAYRHAHQEDNRPEYTEAIDQLTTWLTEKNQLHRFAALLHVIGGIVAVDADMLPSLAAMAETLKDNVKDARMLLALEDFEPRQTH